MTARKDLERSRRIVASAGPYKVQSCADNTYRVTPSNRGRGVLSRLALAQAISDVLSARQSTVESEPRGLD